MFFLLDLFGLEVFCVEEDEEDDLEVDEEVDELFSLELSLSFSLSSLLFLLSVLLILSAIWSVLSMSSSECWGLDIACSLSDFSLSSIISGELDCWIGETDGVFGAEIIEILFFDFLEEDMGVTWLSSSDGEV